MTGGLLFRRQRHVAALVLLRHWTNLHSFPEFVPHQQAPPASSPSFLLSIHPQSSHDASAAADTTWERDTHLLQQQQQAHTTPISLLQKGPRGAACGWDVRLHLPMLLRRGCWCRLRSFLG